MKRNLTTRGPGRPKNPELTDEDRRAHRRLSRQRVEDRQPERLVTITLRLAHNINGVQIGPGEVTVPYGQAQELLYTEDRARREEERFQGGFWKGDVE